jgi:hypothetical protein
MNKIYYYANVLIGVPLLFIVAFSMNMWKLTKQAFRWSVAETKSAYQENRRHYKM